MNQEPSVLDFIKTRIQDWRHKIFATSVTMDETYEPEVSGEDSKDPLAVQTISNQTLTETPLAVQTTTSQTLTETSLRIPWRVLLVLGIGLWAQLSLEPHPGSNRTWQVGAILYLMAGLVLIWTNLREEWTLKPWGLQAYEAPRETSFLQSSLAFMVALVFSLIAFVAFGGNKFTVFNVVIWITAILTMIRALWHPGAGNLNWVYHVKDSLFRSKWNISLNRSALLVLAVFGLALFFRVYHLSDVPSQMVSDHAEKLLDVGDVLDGKTSIFFPRNTGREFFQFYLTATIILLFKTGLSFLSLKIGTVLAGLITLFYLYLLGKEVGGSRVGLLALAFAGIAYWPNVISRFGLRFPLYPLFYAPALYYLIWGLRTRNRLGFILSGLFLGLGLHGYSPFRVAPFVIVLAIGLYLLHKQSEGYRLQAIWGIFTIGIIALIVFLPLMRYMLENPDIVLFRGMTRVGDLERPLPGPAWQIFLQNLWNSLTMFAWDDGEVWPISVPHRPVLDVVTSVFFHLGVLLVILRYLRQRHWMDIFTLLSIPVLMIPSILSLAFPGENPSLNRSAGAIVPVFLVVALSFDSFLSALGSLSASKWNRRFTWIVGVFLLAYASLQNYDLLFNQYKNLYDLSSWNTSEMGEVVRDFSNLTGSSDTVWLVGYPFWADSRLVMINAGFPGRDNGILLPNFPDSLEDPRPKLYLVNLNDLATMDALKSRYPDGWWTEYQSKHESKNFMLFFVPGR